MALSCAFEEETDLKVRILGTKYKIETHKISEDRTLMDNQWAGYCGEDSKLIVIADMSEKKFFPDRDEKELESYRKQVLRHEIVHAFLNESGLSSSTNVPGSGWAKNEEMIDWLAIQSPKIYKVFREVGCL